ELYAGTDKVIDEIVVINYTLGEVTDVTKNAKTGYTTYTIEGASVCSDDPDAAVEVVLAGAVAEEDWVTFVEPTGAGKVFVYPTTKMTGEVVSVTNDGVATMGGKTYTASAAGSVTLAVADEANYWLDQYGYVVKTSAISADASNFAYVVDAYATFTEGFGAGVPAVKVKVLMADGTVGVYDLKIAKKDGAYKVIDIDGNAGAALASESDANAYATALKNSVYSYSVADTTIALKAATAVAADSVEGNYVVGMDSSVHTLAAESGYVVKNDVAVKVNYGSAADATLNDKTTFIFWDAKDGEVDEVVVGNTKLGDKKFAYDANTKVIVSAEAAKLTAKYVFVMGGFATETESVDAYGYIDASTYVVTKDSDDNTVRTYTLTMVDGTKVSVSATTTFLSEDGLYSYETDKSVAAANKLSARVAYGAAEVEGSIATIGGTAYNYTADTKVIFLGDDTKLDGATEVYGWVNKLSNGSAGNVLEAVFVIS
ncbi:MAG: hypothetical protein IIV78_01570, partial [Oscillospiraceae bacterium]|nr:hypothetical protein [Oscillospiraceae bacterium]